MRNVILCSALCLSILAGGDVAASPQCPAGVKVDDGKACTLDECSLYKGKPRVSHKVACPKGATCNAKGVCEKIDPNAACKGVDIDDGKACTDDTCTVVNGKPVVTHKKACPAGAACNSDGLCEQFCHPAYAYSEDTSGCSEAEYVCIFQAMDPSPCPEGLEYEAFSHFTYQCSKDGSVDAKTNETKKVADSVECLPGYIKNAGTYYYSPDPEKPEKEDLIPKIVVTCSLPNMKSEEEKICGDLKVSKYIPFPTIKVLTAGPTVADESESGGGSSITSRVCCSKPHP